MAQTLTQESLTDTVPAARELRNQIPPHLPIKIKVKNLNNEHLLRDLEIEVTNKSEKPIYYLKLGLFLPGTVGPSGKQVGYPLRYGRLELIDLRNMATPEDVPIRPGETYVFKVSEAEWRGWEQFAAEKKLPKSEPREVGVRFQVLNFGDGTGFVTTSGMPVPRKQAANRKVLLEPHEDESLQIFRS
jgi:hypothetical protein